MNLLNEVLDQLNPILDELSVEFRESRLSKETESSESTRLLESSNRLVPVTPAHSPHEIYSNVEIRYAKVENVLKSMESLKVKFIDEKLVRLTRSTSTSSFDSRG